MAMAIHYNAFISYRHHPNDIRVATEIHRALERFHIPKAVRKNQKGALRLFRDKDELPITSNLSDNITMALENSDYLIVICSTHTKESLWVQREIETFLRTHTYDKVLTVLVDGEPYDTIPEILQYRDQVDPQTGKVTKVAMEPLSCDWRIGKKQAMREELPRLAAVLLGCGYDELRQRQRQYKMRRAMTILGAATAASLCLMAYFLYTSIIIQQANDDLHAANEEISRANAEIIAANEEISQANEEIRQANVQIQANLEEALRNQSQYLSSAATERYLAGDRLTAISLALAALPSEEALRPYVPAAELTLSDALGIYEVNRGVTASGIMDCGALIEDFAVSADGGVLYALDRAGRITVWDTGTYTQLAAMALGTSDYRSMMTAGENLLVRLNVEYGSGNPELLCCSPQGRVLWSVEKCLDLAMQGSETVMVLDYSLVDAQATISFLDPAAGSRQREDIAIPIASNISPGGFYQDHYAAESLVTLDFGSWDEDHIYLLDTRSGAVEVISPYSQWEAEQISDLSILAVSVTDRGDVLAMISDDSGSMNGAYNNMIMTSPANAYVLCFRGEGRTLAWRQQVSSYSYSQVRTMEPIPGSDRILCQKDNVFHVLDGATGQVLARCEAPANVCSIYVEADRTYGVLANGCYFLYDYEDNDCSALQLMDADIIQAKVADAYFTLTADSTHITVYRSADADRWTPFAESPGSYIRWDLAHGSRLVTLASDGSVQAFDMETGTCLWTGTVSSAYSAESLGFSPDGSALYVRERDTVLAFDMASGAMRTMEIPETIEGSAADICGFGYGALGRLHYMLKMEDDLYFAVMDLGSGETTVYPFRLDTGEDVWDIGDGSGAAAASGDYAWLWDQGTLYELELAAGTVRPVLEGLTEYPLCTYHEAEDLLSLGVGSEIIFYRPGGEETMRVTLGEQKAVDVGFLNGELLAVTNEAQLLRFDMDGNRLSQTELHVYTSFYNYSVPTAGKQVNISWVYTGGDLVLNVLGLGNIIDCSQWDVRAYALNYKAYDARTDRLVCYNESQLGSFPRYTTDQVMALAQEELNGYTLPQEMKESYGIG